MPFLVVVVVAAVAILCILGNSCDVTYFFRCAKIFVDMIDAD